MFNFNMDFVLFKSRDIHGRINNGNINSLSERKKGGRGGIFIVKIVAVIIILICGIKYIEKFRQKNNE